MRWSWLSFGALVGGVLGLCSGCAYSLAAGNWVRLLLAALNEEFFG